MKKLIVVLLASALLLVGCSSGGPYKTITTVKAQEMIDEKQSFYLVVGSATCTYCAEYKKVMTKIVDKYKVSINYLELGSGNYSEVTSFVSKTLGQTVDSTPTTFVIVDGKVDVKQEGTLTENVVEKLLLKYGYISEIKAN